ncbi:unnamed protein product [Larinioides sclopetarius]|uniref:Uncharacterized protein n=1 Tax=Larinioides sclopetarius TaxID=280406 RepID=A0AAV2AIN2_9ARAC
MKFHKILSSSFCASALKKFRLHTPHRQTERHFLKIVESCSGAPKTCRSIKKWRSKIFAFPILSSYRRK